MNILYKKQIIKFYYNYKILTKNPPKGRFSERNNKVTRVNYRALQINIYLE
jgi:hypothetical protein